MNGAQPVQLYAEDLREGFRFRGEPKALTDARFRAFADMTGDAHPIHYDAAYAANTRFGKPIAHGLLLTSLTALGSTALSAQLEESMIAMIEQRWLFEKPGFVGDTVTCDYEVKVNHPTSNGRQAKVAIEVALRNQAGDVLVRGVHIYLIRMRGGG
jgi:acyl dehydratase